MIAPFTPDLLTRDFLTALLQQQAHQAQRWAGHGGHWQWLGEGALQWEPADLAHRHADLVLSCGIHGDETAPVEVCNHLIRDLAAGHLSCRARVLFLFGNPEALRQHRRYLDDDLNRMFDGRHQQHPGSREATRAAQLERWLSAFFMAAPAAAHAVPRLHYDLHTAIRGSRFGRFALYPYRADLQWNEQQMAWLQRCGVDAVLLNEKPAGTFSYFSSSRFGADAFTLELGKVRRFGENDLSRFSGMDQGLRTLLAAPADSTTTPLPRRFRVAGEIVRQSEAGFQLHIPDDVENFTAFPRGTVLATDGDYRYVVGHDEECIVFPNPKVKPGLRAGLLVVEIKP
ncbi:succinylglutamate desuccinylase [Leeia aquatica]|uniref:Succinylglutamate desuccinylase n=1 Tax=Leeia aquatica TaxID=2725557 RepID=A0A847S6L5_9NEIS|nr:succinylglutamate desuccinylase [Leeia aquatica]NLR74697.1 succinylglutamate desuccinylase [Leeia aquatica]